MGDWEWTGLSIMIQVRGWEDYDSVRMIAVSLIERGKKGRRHVLLTPPRVVYTHGLVMEHSPLLP